MNFHEMEHLDRPFTDVGVELLRQQAQEAGLKPYLAELKTDLLSNTDINMFLGYAAAVIAPRHGEGPRGMMAGASFMSGAAVALRVVD
ncbi:MAG: hypothetical protein ABI221_01250 [Candidatus Saccharimonadales bacterium]